MKILYYTSTGNSLAVAKQFDAELYSIPQMLKENKFDFEDEKIGFVFPVYASTTPRVVVEFLEKVTVKSPYVFVIISNAGGVGSCVNHFVKCAEKRNIKISYSNDVVSVSNYLKGAEMQAQIDKYDDVDFMNNVKKIVEDVNNNVCSVKMGGGFMGAMSPMFYAGFNKFIRKTAKTFTVESKCNLCGTCAKVCPMKNVTVTDKVEFGENCMSCYACTQNCPSNAIRVKGEKSKVRYRNPKVNLKEIIEANNRN